MRHATHVLIALSLVLSHCSLVVADEPPSLWWPFGKPDADPPESSPPATSPPPEVTPETGEDENWWQSLPKPSWPQFGAPSSPHKAPRMNRSRTASRTRPGQVRQRNAWAQPEASPAEAQSEGFSWDSVTGGAERIGESTRTAWHKTVDALTPGSATEAAPAPREPRVSWWSRMWGAEDPQTEGPRTVTEWMAQDRLDP